MKLILCVFALLCLPACQGWFERNFIVPDNPFDNLPADNVYIVKNETRTPPLKNGAYASSVD